MDKKKLQSFKGGEVVRNSSLLTALSSLTNGGKMKKFLMFLLVIVLIVFQGCGYKTDKWQKWSAPNWTSDGKIVFLEDKGEQRIDSWGDMVGGNQKITLYEINSDGTGLKEIREILSCEFDDGSVLGAISTSSAGNWVVLSIEDWRIDDHYPVMYVVNRDGSQLEEVGSGRYPDFSPDASQIVYEKPDNGIWVMERDGSGDHQIIADEDALKPSWSPDGLKIAYDVPGITIIDTTGELIKHYDISRPLSPDWNGSSDTLGLGNGLTGRVRFINIETDSIIEIGTNTGGEFKWAPDGNKFIGYDEDGYFVINRNGSNKWYLKP